MTKTSLVLPLQKRIRLFPQWLLLLALVAALAPCSHATASIRTTNPPVIDDIAITDFQEDYNRPERQLALVPKNAQDFFFDRFQPPKVIESALQAVHNPLKWYQSKDGRRGYVSSTKLGGDWVLAESQQTVYNCTCREVLQAYLSGDLQREWNQQQVIDCHFQCKSMREEETQHSKKRGFQPPALAFHKRIPPRATKPTNTGKYYQQDLVLKSQRVITEKTGIMKYSQVITIDQIGNDNYSVLVRLQEGGSTKKKPFDSLQVYVGLEQKGSNVDIYAAGVFEVNRKVVPNLLVFDASGIAGSMAGKGTLWLAGYFDQRRKKIQLEESSAASTSR